MSVRLSSLLHDRLIASARAAAGEEICGLLLGTRDAIADIVPAANVARDRARRFEIDPATLLAAHRSARQGGRAVIGHYHSHPQGNPVPSPTDAAQALPDGQFWLVIASGGMRLWQAGEGGLHDRFVERQLIVEGQALDA
ncbi:M67 family metallopeptidase [Sphingobium algorifonticola]|uniref:M67 family peptidase n=1 Tax=Sphingobium algorifonticola TaxID=2008318 RepID=A0A437JBK2_9SPHN|nr:M67 family metallopeptidase [Sphingobium algorifonticola]RVT43153.1 M67 family peptidase [Sphingobium algorifonticola]